MDGSGGDGAHRDYSNDKYSGGSSSGGTGGSVNIKTVFAYIAAAFIGAVLGQVLFHDGEAVFYGAFAGAVVYLAYCTTGKRARR